MVMILSILYCVILASCCFNVSQNVILGFPCRLYEWVYHGGQKEGNRGHQEVTGRHPNNEGQKGMKFPISKLHICIFQPRALENMTCFTKLSNFPKHFR